MTLTEELCGPREVRGRAITAPDGGTAGPCVAANESGNHAPTRSVAGSGLRGDAGARGRGCGAGRREGDGRRAAPGRDAMPGRAVSERDRRGSGLGVAWVSSISGRRPRAVGDEFDRVVVWNLSQLDHSGRPTPALTAVHP